MLIRAAVFLITLSGLVFEIGLTRIYSATIWYHFAFVAISMALLGWGLGGLAVHLLKKSWPASTEKAALFTMLYGVGWIIATDTSTARFVVMTVALAITLALGYARFVRGRAPAPATAASGVGDFPGLERRVRELERRMNDAATALSPRTDRQPGV